MLGAAVIWGLLVVAITELLSLADALEATWITTAWILVSAALVVALVGRRRRNSSQVPPTVTLADLTASERIYVGGLATIAAVTGFIAVYAPPNNWDSMSYHLARVVNWLQNGSVAHYPTHYLQNLTLNPWAEFAVSHFYSLTGSDRLVNLVQWFSLVGSVIAVSAIAKQLGANRRGQILSAVVAATIPMAILQASSTQNDLVVTFWLLCMVHFGLRRKEDTSHGIADIIFLGGSIGLAILTKGTAYVYAFPFLVWFIASDLKRFRWKMLKPWAGMAGIALTVNAGHYLRNLAMFSSPLGITEGDNVFSNQAYSVPLFLSNMFKNVALHLATPVRSINLLTIDAVEGANDLLDVATNDPRTAMVDFDIPSLINHEDFAGALVMLVLIVAVVAHFLVTRKRLEDQRSLLVAYLVSVTAAALLYVLVFRWQIWAARLHLPLLVLMAPFVGAQLAKWRATWVAALVAAGLLALSVPYLLFNETRPVVANSELVEADTLENIFVLDRTELYFLSRKDVMAGYLQAIDYTETLGCTNVGILLDESGNESAWEYPFWVLLEEDEPDVRIESVAVANISRFAYDPDGAEPQCAILYAGPESGATVDWLGRTYRSAWSTSTPTITVAVLTPS